MGKLFYLPEPIYDGRILDCVFNSDLNQSNQSTMNLDYQEVEFSETGDLALYRDIKATLNQIDKDNYFKYLVIDDNGTLMIDEMVGWKQHNPFEGLG
jgi:hypothetical protein